MTSRGQALSRRLRELRAMGLSPREAWDVAYGELMAEVERREARARAADEERRDA